MVGALYGFLGSDWLDPAPIYGLPIQQENVVKTNFADPAPSEEHQLSRGDQVHREVGARLRHVSSLPRIESPDHVRQMKGPQLVHIGILRKAPEHQQMVPGHHHRMAPPRTDPAGLAGGVDADLAPGVVPLCHLNNGTIN